MELIKVTIRQPNQENDYYDYDNDLIFYTHNRYRKYELKKILREIPIVMNLEDSGTNESVVKSHLSDYGIYEYELKCKVFIDRIGS